MSRRIEFSVDLFLDSEAGTISIGGRCCKDDIVVGDVFESIYTYDWSGIGSQPITRKIDIRPIRLEVVRILFYRKSIDELSSGHTAGITFKGDIEARISEGDFLGGVMDDIRTDDCDNEDQTN